jgi:hypothetical protein
MLVTARWDRDGRRFPLAVQQYQSTAQADILTVGEHAGLRDREAGVAKAGDVCYALQGTSCLALQCRSHAWQPAAVSRETSWRPAEIPWTISV